MSEVSEVSERSFFSPNSVSTSALVPAPGGDISHDLDGSSLAKFQAMCSSVHEMKVNPSLTVISHSIGNNDILCDISTGSLRPLVPLQLRHKLFLQLHSISHPGVRASRRLISSRFVWPGMLVCGPNHVFHAKDPKYQLTFVLQFLLFQYQPGDFLTFMWILLVLFRQAMVLLIYSP